MKIGSQMVFAVREKFSTASLQQIVDYYNPKGLNLSIDDMEKWNAVADDQARTPTSLKSNISKDWVRLPFTAVIGLTN